VLRAVVGALLKSVRRDLAGYASLQTNNFFLFVVLMIWGAAVSGVAPVASYPFLVALGMLMILPASGDPMAKIPPVRLGLWPLPRAARAVLRIAGLALNPAFWLLAVLIAIRSGVAIAGGFIGLIAGARVITPRLTRARPAIGTPAPLLTNNFRQILCVLDTWLAIAIGFGGGLWRVFARAADSEAFPILGILAALALSTYAQCLFAFDDDAGLTRYRLLPMTGWRIVLAKDVAFLGVLLIALLPLSIPRGLAFGLSALALGRYPSMRIRLEQQRWRFTSGRVVWGVLQCVVGIGLPLAGAAAVYAISLWWAGREWDRR
jgi:hypothetical protein